MAQLDRQVWAGGVAFNAYGLHLGVRFNDASFHDEVVERLPHGWTASRRPAVGHLYSVVLQRGRGSGRLRRYSLLYSGSHRVARHLDAEEVLAAFESHVRLLVAEMSQRRVFLHSGVVGWRGQAILIPGRTFTGKSTLVAELIRQGARYYSDEFAVLDADGTVHPFHKPVSLRSPEDGRGRLTSAAELGGRIGSKPLPVGQIYLTRYRAGSTFRPRRLTPAKALLELLSVTAIARREPERALDVLGAVVARAETWKGARGEAAQVAASILERARLDR